MSVSRLSRIVSIVGLLGFAVVGLAAEPAVEPLWPAGAPGAHGDTDNDRPTLTVYLPPAAQATGAAVVICPGGGYGHLAIDHEGHQVARWLNSFGVAGFIVKYRHHGTGYQHPAPLQDAQRAIRTVRARAAEWRVKPDRVGIIGFSAGGHLASTAGTHFDDGRKDDGDAIERQSCRPDFMLLVYPVISFTEPFAHQGSRRNLLGEDADPALVERFSNEKQVTPRTPPTFLVHTDGDTGVPSENSIAFYLALRKARVPAEMHVFEKGPHGLGLGVGKGGFGAWPGLCETWMRGRGLLAEPETQVTR